MITLSGLKYRGDDSACPILQIFAHRGIRDQLLQHKLDLLDIHPIEIELDNLSQEDLDDIQILVSPKEAEFGAIVGGYVAEQLARMCGRVKKDVEQAIANGNRERVDELSWSAKFSVAGARFIVTINGLGKLNSFVSAHGMLTPEQLQGLLFDVTSLVRRAALPLILRAIPRPPSPQA